LKRVLKLLFSVLLWAADRLADAARMLTGRKLPARCMVLYYHAIPARLRERFVRQMDLLLNVAQPLPSDAAGPLQPGIRYAVVTFDDGFHSVAENAWPELRKREIPWTTFVPSGCLGQQPAWLRHANGETRQDCVMSPEELRSLCGDPLVLIGSHTVRHANLLETAAENAVRELAQSKAELESILARPVRLFSYPFGARSPALDRQAQLAGYRRVFTSEPSLAFQAPDEWVTGRISVDPSDWMLEFRLKVLGAYRWSAWLKKATGRRLEANS